MGCVEGCQAYSFGCYCRWHPVEEDFKPAVADQLLWFEVLLLSQLQLLGL
jgi:hypothetical protein